MPICVDIYMLCFFNSFAVPVKKDEDVLLEYIVSTRDCCKGFLYIFNYMETNI